MTSPVISVVTIAFNCLDDLKATVNSTQAVMAGFSYEHVVVDGGSTDGTLAFLNASWSAEKFISEPDRGIYDAMNKGVSLASGDYVIFMNAGDEFHKDFSPKDVAKVLEFDNPDVLVCNAERMKNKYKKIPFERHKISSICSRLPFCHQATFVKRRLHAENPFRREAKIAGDYEFFLNLYADGIGFKYIPNVVAVVDNCGVSNTKKLRSTIERYKVYKESKINSSLLVDVTYFYFMFRSLLSDLMVKCGFR